MIDFACKKFDIAEVVKCGLGLSKSEFNLLNFLIKNDKQFTTEELAEKLGVDKSTIQRAVKKMHAQGLLFRSQINKSSGGYVFLYKVKDKEKIRQMVIDIIEGWTNVFREQIKNW